jgi:hypothetical protein
MKSSGFSCAALLVISVVFLLTYRVSAPREPAVVAPAAEESPLVKITNIAEKAEGIDTKLPLEWTVDEKAGKVTMMGINIFQCDGDWNPEANAAVIFIRLDDPAILNARKWTLFAKDVDKNWLFQGSQAGQKELKPNTKYCMNYVLSGEKGDYTVHIFFQTK